MTPGFSARLKSMRSHWPTGPVRLPDSHLVAGLPSTAENGLRPVALCPGSAEMPAPDEEAVTLAMP